MNIDSSWFQWFGLALMRHQHRTIIKTDWQRQSFIHDWLSFTTGFHSRLAFIHDWLSFVIGQRRWFGLVSAIAKTADYDQSKALKAPADSPTSKA
jgi:hypothetical protein